MSAPPEWVDPRRLAAERGSVDGEIATTALSRLTPELDSASGPSTVWVRLDFAEDAQRRITISGWVQAHLCLQCQRCLGPADWSADLAVKAMAVSDDDAAAAVPKDWEPVVPGPRGLSPAALAEDELLLALPVAAHCRDQTCRERYERQDTQNARSDNPFAVLNELKRGR